jgi:AraC-like DNA-binding protein
LPDFRVRVAPGRYALEIWSGDFCRFDRYPTNHAHVHETYHELCLVLAGSGEFAHGNERIPLSPGAIFFSEKDTPHEISSFVSRNLALVFVHLTIDTTGLPLSADPYDRVIDRFVRGHTLATGGCRDLEVYFDLAVRGNRSSFDSVRRAEAGKLFVLEALDRLATVPEKGTTSPVSAELDPAARAIAYIDANLNHCPSVDCIARACFCSPRHLRRLFRAKTGKTILATVNERRVKLAAQQLLMRFTVSQVAESLGFESLAHFSRLFKRYHGMNAKEFQMRCAPKPVVPKTSFLPLRLPIPSPPLSKLPGGNAEKTAELRGKIEGIVESRQRGDFLDQ